MFEIEDGIPIPPRKGHRKYPFADMKPGQSIFIPTLMSKEGLISTAKRYGGKWTARSLDGGVRIWRVE